MTSFRNSEEPYSEDTMAAANWLVGNIYHDDNKKDKYRHQVYHSRYYFENADPVYEANKRGVIFE